MHETRRENTSNKPHPRELISKWRQQRADSSRGTSESPGQKMSWASFDGFANKLLKKDFWSNILNANNAAEADGNKKYTLEELARLYTVLVHNPDVNEVNRDMVVETIRSIAEFITWGENHDPKIFEFLIDNHFMAYLLNLLQPAHNRTGDVAKQILQTLNIMVQNIRSTPGIDFLFSGNYLNRIVETAFDFEDEEVLGLYVSLLKTITLQLKPQTIKYFLVEADDTEGLPRLPLFTEAVKLAHHKEGMVRAGVRTITLGILSIRHSSAYQLLCGPVATSYYGKMMEYIAEQLQTLQQCMLDVFAGYSSHSLSHMDSELAELEDMLSYCNDIMETAHPPIAKQLVHQFWTGLVLPHLLQPLLATAADGGMSSQQIISLAIALYTLERCFSLLGYAPLLNNLALAVIGIAGDSSSVSSSNGSDADLPARAAATQSPAVSATASPGLAAGSSGSNVRLSASVATIAGSSVLTGELSEFTTSCCRQELLSILASAHPITSGTACRMLVAMHRCRKMSKEVRLMAGLGLHASSSVSMATPAPPPTPDEVKEVTSGVAYRRAYKAFKRRQDCSSSDLQHAFAFLSIWDPPKAKRRPKLPQAMPPGSSQALTALPTSSKALPPGNVANNAVEQPLISFSDDETDSDPSGVRNDPVLQQRVSQVAPAAAAADSDAAVQATVDAVLNDMIDEVVSGLSALEPCISVPLSTSPRKTPVDASNPDTPSTDPLITSSLPNGYNRTSTGGFEPGSTHGTSVLTVPSATPSVSGTAHARGHPTAPSSTITEDDDAWYENETPPEHVDTEAELLGMYIPDPCLHLGKDILSAVLVLLAQSMVPAGTLQLAGHVIITSIMPSTPALAATPSTSVANVSAGGAESSQMASPTSRAAADANSNQFSQYVAPGAGTATRSSQSTPRSNLSTPRHGHDSTTQPASEPPDMPCPLDQDLQQLLRSALTAAATAVGEQLDGCWPDAFFPVFQIEWTAAAKSLEKPSMMCSADQLLSGAYMQLAEQATLQAMGLGPTAAQALYLCHAIQRLAAVLKLTERCHLVHSRSVATLQWMTGEMARPWLDVVEGQQVQLSKANSIPCQVCFKPPDPIHASLAVAGDAATAILASQDRPLRAKAVLCHSSPTVVLAQPSSALIDAGTVVSTAPLLGSDFHPDPKVSVWLHVVVRPAITSLLKQVSKSAQRGGSGLAASLRSLCDGHWILQCTEEKRVTAALQLVRSSSVAARKSYKELVNTFLSAWIDSSVV